MSQFLFIFSALALGVFLSHACDRMYPDDCVHISYQMVDGEWTEVCLDGEEE